MGQFASHLLSPGEKVALTKLFTIAPVCKQLAAWNTDDPSGSNASCYNIVAEAFL